jgi:hypothetical protein
MIRRALKQQRLTRMQLRRTAKDLKTPAAKKRVPRRLKARLQQ